MACRQAGGHGQQESAEVEQKEMSIPALGEEETPGTHPNMLGDVRLESSFAVKALGLLVDTKWNISQQCALAAQVASGAWVALGRALPVGQGKWVSLLLCSALVRAHLECRGQVWAPQSKRDMDLLEKV